ncbi:hypothetical protein P3T22_006699 [Paraburkholderia sp. GAS348]|jgi:hypothetical protein|uniref:Uncharacterized protein n=1 Tax=Paraburkholderia phytofirmans OLGA172 TaxID=1417228 RepID=A0A160FI48_9BURK|nr:hypothetical protein AYM40_04780 [Paraburkholderia phytofirmans OLGA172]
MTRTAEPILPRFGSEISGVDIPAPLDATVQAELLRAAGACGTGWIDRWALSRGTATRLELDSSRQLIDQSVTELIARRGNREHSHWCAAHKAVWQMQGCFVC